MVAGSQVSIRLTMATSAPIPSVFTVNEPARLSIDLPDTELGVDQRYQRIDQGAVEAVAMAEGDNRTRVVIELTSMTDYTVNRDGNAIVIGVGGDVASQTAPAALQPAGNSSYQPAPASVRGPRVRDIDFRRGEDGAGRQDVCFAGLAAPVFEIITCIARRANCTVVAFGTAESCRWSKLCRILVREGMIAFVGNAGNI